MRSLKAASPPRKGCAGPMMMIFMERKCKSGSLLPAQSFFYKIIVARRRIPGDELTQETGQEKHGAEDHGSECYVKYGPLGNECGMNTVVHIIKFTRAQPYHRTKADEEHPRSPQPEKVHGPLPESSHERDRHQVEKAVDETFQAEFTFAVLTLAVLHHLLSYLMKARPLRDNGNVTVHLAIHFYRFHHILAIGFEPAVEIVQVIYFGDLACGPVE